MTSSRQFSRYYRAFSLAVGGMLYGLAFLSMKFVITRSGFGIHELGQVALTLTAMTLLMVIFHLIPNLLVQSASLFLQFLGGLFLGILVGPFVWLKILWVIPLIIQFGLVMDLIVFFPLSMFVTLSHFNESAEIVAWGRSLPDPITRDRLVGAAVTIAAVLIVGAVRYLYNRLREQENLVENLKTNILKLTRANYDFQRYAADTEEITMKKERLRISREIHDTVGYTMTTLRMMLEAGTDLISESPLKLEVQLRKALEIVNRGHHDIRVSLRELRERESDRPRGLKGLKSLIDLFSETTGVSVRPEWGNIPWLFPDDVEAVLYRFVQEGMSNALSHGNATEIDIHFRMDDDDIIVVLSDDGVGADVLIEGLGLHGMRERIENCGGSFEARNSRQGFFLQARLPLKEGEIGEDPAVDC